MNQEIKENRENDKIVSDYIKDRLEEEMEYDSSFAEKLVESLNTKILIK
tara:strand:- start:639 stop:785 length:147 start_codon:yes stop_codon:yes gene_type:complete